MSYPISKEQVPDAWARGKVEMFAKAVELRNKNASLISVDAITELYQEVKEYCLLNTELIVQIKGEKVTE